MRKLLTLLTCLLAAPVAQAQIFSAMPFNLQNGTVADASQVMANLNQLVANGNSNAAKNGANTDITSLGALGNGTAGSPALRFLSAATTGLYFDGTSLGFSVGGVEQAWVPPPGETTPSAVFYAGEVRMFAASTCPLGWEETDGAAISRTTYAGLFSVIGTVWGVGDGLTTFNLPDLRGTVPRAWDHGRGLDPAAPAFAAYEADGYGSHNHGVTDPGHAHAYTSATANTAAAGAFAMASPLAATTGSATTGITVNNSGAAETLGKSTIVLYCIKT